MPAEQTIPELLARRRRDDPDVRALVDDGGAITYAELDDASRTLTAGLVGAGVSKGDRVGLLMPNGIAWATTALAVLRIGAVLVPLSTLLRPPELRAQLQVAAVTHLIAVRDFRGRSYLDDLASVAPVPSLRRVWADDELPADPAPAALVQALEDVVRPADDLVVLFTSGSRGAPKGIVHTHGNALRAVAAGLDARRIERGTRLYIPMPFFWTGGFSQGLLSVLVAGATLLTEATPEPGRTLALLERERATLFRGWPDQAARIAAHPGFATADLSSLGPGSLGAVLPAGRRPAPGARPNLFGMTESFGPYCGDRLDVDLPPAAHGSCGRPFAGFEVRIADPDGEGPDGEGPDGEGPDGEIWLRGPNLLRGICGRDRSTAFTPDGWYRTGDLGHLDDDGYLFYAGRLDDMVKVRGATVYPSEVEAALSTVPGVTRAHVTDVDTGGGHPQVAALVVTRLDRAGLVAAARERLSAFKVPTVWLVTDDADAVPLSPTGKVDKHRLQQLLRSQGESATFTKRV
jgi:acyl-CoA synthetase (AMP-forming)/AMP-acid ligase II